MVSGPGRAEVDPLIASLRVVDVDTSGCRARIEFSIELPVGRPPVVAGANAALTPGRPIGLNACMYRRGLIERSASVDGRRAETVVATLNAQPAGLSITRPDTYVPAQCGPRSTDTGDDLTYRLEAA